MHNIRPQDLPEIRSDMRTYFGTPLARQVFAHYVANDQLVTRPDGTPAQAARTVTDLLQRHFALAELFYVSEDMTDLAIHAAATMPPFQFERQDMPADHGLVVFAKPIDVLIASETGEVVPAAHRDTPVSIVAASWGLMPPGTIAAQGGIWLSVYADQNELITSLGRQHDEATALRARQILPPLSYNNECVINFGVSSDAVPTDTTASYFMTVRTAWVLMQQQVARTSIANVDRATQRRLFRRQEQPKPVRVITLRHAPTAGTSEGGREYRHRWIVRGHWRNQWLPSRNVHRPIWIAPHVKGPEDAPLLTGEKVYAWTR